MFEPETRKAARLGEPPPTRATVCARCPFGATLAPAERRQAAALKSRLAGEPSTVWACHETAGRDDTTVGPKALVCAGFVAWRALREERFDAFRLGLVDLSRRTGVGVRGDGVLSLLELADKAADYAETPLAPAPEHPLALVKADGSLGPVTGLEVLAFRRDLAALSARHAVRVAGHPELFLLDDEDQNLAYDLDAYGNLLALVE
jgi:hypothetical protein